MAHIKLRRFQEAEDDCTEALNLDDRYIKAYSRRPTARKELGKNKESMEDAEFAMRLEPNNQEVKKQYADAKSLYEKEILHKTSKALRNTVQKMGKSEAKVNGSSSINFVSHGTQKSGPAEAHHQTKGNERKIPAKKSLIMEEINTKDTKSGSRTQGQVDNGSKEGHGATNSLEQRNHKTREPKIKASVEQLASRAASLAMAEVAKNITPPLSVPISLHFHCNHSPPFLVYLLFYCNPWPIAGSGLRVNKQSRAAGVLENFSEGEKYTEHLLRKFSRNRSLEIMPGINGFFTDPSRD
ncbi:hypothetical protein RYX36_011231 [Vicia faba]